MEITLTPDQEFKIKRERAQRNLMWLGIGSIVMVFAGLTSAYIVRRGQGDWFSIMLPQVFWISSAVIIFSSVTMNLAMGAFRKDKLTNGTIFLGITFLLGLGFAWFQFQGWSELVNQGIYLAHVKGQNSLVSGSFIYVLSGLHLAHMAGGLLSLIFVFVKSLMGKYGSANLHGLRVAAIYWHFLDFLWIYLFVFLTIFK
jgi:cytochrome c oxidase subunit III